MADIIIKDPNGELGGAGLPEVDSGDNGKVLTVVSGEWAPATASGGAAVPKIAFLEWGDNSAHFVDVNGDTITLKDVVGLKYIVAQIDQGNITRVGQATKNGDGHLEIEWPLTVDANGDIVRSTWTLNKTTGALISTVQKKTTVTWVDY